MDKKTAGLYVSLAKALKALDDAGESVQLAHGEALGISATVSPYYRTDGEWSVVDHRGG